MIDKTGHHHLQTREQARVFTIKTGAPFLETLADALLDGKLVPGFPDKADPLSLSRATIFLPTRRAARAFSTLLAERFAPSPVLLPRIVPLGDIDDAELFIATEGEAFIDSALAATFAPSLGGTERRLILTQLVLSWARAIKRALLRLDDHEPLLVPASPADALALAGDLARLMDVLTTEDVPWDALASLVEERHSQYYAITLKFLAIAAEQWPHILSERQASDPVARRHKLTLKQAEQISQRSPAGPMIVAGSTGSIPATAKLISAIAHLEEGAVVLPGLDNWLDDETWAIISGKESSSAPTHPQAVLHQLLKTIGVGRNDVISLGKATEKMQARQQFLSISMRPAETTECWYSEHQQIVAQNPLADVALIEAQDERVEALAAAIAMREVVEQEGKTVALVTPDRALAERVSIELARWGITAEDSAGLSLSNSKAGTLARLIAQVATSHFAPEPLLALLAHPMALFGRSRAEIEKLSTVIEIGLLRGPSPPAGLAGLLSILPARREQALHHHAARPLAAISDEDWEHAERFLHELQEIFSPLVASSMGRKTDIDLVSLAPSHAITVMRVATTPDTSVEIQPVGEGWDELADLFDDLSMVDASGITGRFADYPAVFQGLADERIVQREAGSSVHPRVKIWGLLEARLLHVDRVVLGGFDEGIWPPRTRTDAFLNRPMRALLGLSAPEKRIGQTAHDFVEAMGAREVIITRSLKRDGAPTVPSRFLQRMKALAGEEIWKQVTDEGARFIHLARALDKPSLVKPISRPSPKPPKELLPKRLSVTAIETLVRDPYAIYARHVLKLDPLEGIATPPGASDKGTLIHNALGNFSLKWPQQLPDDPLKEVLRFGQEAFQPLTVYPDIAALWWPRFEQLAQAYVEWEIRRRGIIHKVYAEVDGKLEIPLPNGEAFILSARADRIEVSDQGMVIIDYKTGTVPSSKAIFAGFSPQMTLEAAMLKRGAFKGLHSDSKIDLLYVHATGGRDPFTPKPVAQPRGEARSVEQIIEEHFSGLQALLARYFDGKAGFSSRPYVQFSKHEGPYDHLARFREWSVMAGEGEDV